ncbi:MAG: hypothetical protein KDE31_31580, partial [Caldilineaceae bacterium]|nr:hypothetical protein [Caldilineaceae bacterium]
MSNARTYAEWQQLYANIEHTFYLSKSTDDKTDQLTIQAMVVDLSQVAQDLQARAVAWQTLTIIADVIIIPDPGTPNSMVFNLSGENRALTLCARSLQTTGSGGVILSFAADATFTVFADEIVGPGLSFDQTPVQKQQQYKYSITVDPDHIGLTIDGYGQSPIGVDALPQAWQEEGSAFYWQMESAYNCATALQKSDPALALSILQWVHKTTANSAAFSTLNATTAQLLLQLAQFNAKITYVPLLTQRVYQEATGAYMKAAEAFEQAFDQYTTALTLQQNQGAYAKAMLGLYRDKTSGSDQLVAQVEENLADAQKTLANNNERLDSYRTQELNQALKRFEEGKYAFIEKKEDEAIIGIVTAVFTVTASVAAMAVGDEAAAGSAVGGAVEAATALQKLAELIKKIAKMISEITELLEKLRAVQEAVQALLDAQASQGKLPTINVPSADQTFDNTYWEQFTIEAKSVLAEYTTGANKIDGANEYLTALEILAVYGKATYAAQLAVVKYQQKMLQLKLDQLTNRQMQQRLDKLVQQDGADSSAFEQAKLFCYRKLVDTKNRVIILINDEIAAHKYWA